MLFALAKKITFLHQNPTLIFAKLKALVKTC
jgi:hypothetical protein